jgi:translation initiation factor 3 subunit H
MNYLGDDRSTDQQLTLIIIIYFLRILQKTENARRTASGQAPLANEDVDAMFKIPAEPSRLDHLLISGQIDNYCKQINEFAGPTLGKLFAVGELQK